MKDRHKLMQEIQELFLSMKVPTEENEYITSLSAGALRAPNSWLIRMAEIVELFSSESAQELGNLHHYLWTKLLRKSKLLLGQIHYGTIQLNSARLK